VYKIIIVWCLCMCVRVLVSVCMCCVCETCTYSVVDMHPSIRTNKILIQTLMYVEVSIIVVCNQHALDPNKHEQPPDVLGERPGRLSGSWAHIVDRRERHRHSHARTHADTHMHTRTHTDTWHVCTCTYARTRIHTRAETHAHTYADTHTYTRTVTCVSLFY